MHNAEHAIIGAGIIGLTTAFELVDAGVDPPEIVVIDPHPISGATSWPAACWLRWRRCNTGKSRCTR